MNEEAKKPEPEKEKPQQEQPEQEQPKQEQPKQEEPKQEEPKQEQPKPEQPKQEQVKEGKKKKINRLTLQELEKKIQAVKEKMGNLTSSYARQLVKRKEQLLKKPEDSGENNAAT